MSISARRAAELVKKSTEESALRLLAVEDDSAWAALVRELLAGEAGEVDLEAVGTVGDAVDWLRRRGADCVLLDLSLPDASGLEGLETLARAFPALPIVVLTSNEEESSALEAVAHGAEDYLAKRRADGPSIMRAIRYARGRKAAETELRRTATQLNAAEELAHLGSWDWDLKTGAVHPSRALSRIYGIDPESFEGDFDRLHAGVHPDDRGALTQAIERALAGHDRRFEAEYRIARPDGVERVVQAVGEIRRDDTGRPTGILGVGLDVTDQRQAADEVVHTRQRLAREHAMVETLQRSLLPRRLPAISGVELGASYRPATPEGRVGGDFYDVFPIAESRWVLLVGDVSGKGSGAAAISALARYTVRADALREPDPARVLELLNNALVRDGDYFCTAVCAMLDLESSTPTLTVASAGHPPPLLIRDGSARELTGPGMLLGYSADESFEQRRDTLEPRDTLLFYTDGLMDAQAPERLLGPDEIGELAASYGDLPAAEVATRLERAAVQGSARARDDIAILVARIA
jgi:sigma-B regulation protein RsbU (phosphoserine phosphatase)